MKHKVSELEGALLDAAVARALGADWHCGPPLVRDVASIMGWEHFFEYSDEFEPSRLWEHGGPVKERERISTHYRKDGSVYAVMPGDCEWHAEGDDELQAAMRAYVASKFGEEAELP